MANIHVRVPDEWLPALDVSRGAEARGTWLRGVLLRALRSRGHVGLREPKRVSDAVLAARLRRAKRSKSRAKVRDRIRGRRRPGGRIRSREAKAKRLAEMRRLEFVTLGGESIVRRARDGVHIGRLLSGGDYESIATTWGNVDEVWREAKRQVREGGELPAAWEQWRRGQAAWRRARAERRNPKK